MQASASLTEPLDRPEWLPHEEWPFDSRVLEVNGHRIHLIDEGEGPVLLFVHAGLWSFLWRDVIIRLRQHYRCVALDFPGAGLSDQASNFKPSLFNHSRILELVVEKLALEKITLVVHDLGGPVGLAFATRRPELIRGIVVAQSFAWAPGFLLQGMLKLMGSSIVRRVMTRTNLLMRATSSRFGVGRHLGTSGRAPNRLATRAALTPPPPRRTSTWWARWMCPGSNRSMPIIRSMLRFGLAISTVIP